MVSSTQQNVFPRSAWCFHEPGKTLLKCVINAPSPHKELSTLFLTYIQTVLICAKGLPFAEAVVLLQLVWVFLLLRIDITVWLEKGSLSLSGPDLIHTSIFLPSSCSSIYILICNHVAVYLKGKTKQTTQVTKFISICHVFASVP